ncbi:MAG: prenyltransferase/squalene oxidase repeat-containing protein [Candidatus Bathyarchaeia archaeon]
MDSKTILELKKWIQTENIISYIIERQNNDGGYTFCRYTDSSAEDTYFAIQTLKILGIKPKQKDLTIKFLKSLQHKDGSFDSIKVAYYVIKTLNELGAKLEKSPKEFILSLKNSYGGFGSLDVDVEVSSEIESTYYSIEILNLLNECINLDKTISFILSLKNFDGSFGKQGYLRLASTYYAIASLNLLGYNLKLLDKTIEWIRKCESPKGGFTRTPYSFDAYMVIEDFYFGVKALEIMSEICKYPLQTLSLISKFQNNNGGFRRSIFSGISTLEYTYYAVSTTQTILKMLS